MPETIDLSVSSSEDEEDEEVDAHGGRGVFAVGRRVRDKRVFEHRSGTIMHVRHVIGGSHCDIRWDADGEHDECVERRVFCWQLSLEL